MAAILWLRFPRIPDEWLTPLGAVGFMVVLALLVYYMDRRRRLGMQRVAQEMGFSFEPWLVRQPSDQFLSLPVLKRATLASNLLRGSVASGDAVAFDCYNQSGKGRTARTVTVVCLHLAGKSFPEFELGPESIFRKIGAAFGQMDIDFESSPGFSSKYLLRGQEEAAVRELFHPGLLSFFEQNTGWSVEGAGEWLAVYKHRHSIGVSKLGEFVQQAARVASAFL